MPCFFLVSATPILSPYYFNQAPLILMCRIKPQTQLSEIQSALNFPGRHLCSSDSVISPWSIFWPWDCLEINLPELPFTSL